MEKIAGLDYVQLKFDKAGNRLDSQSPFFPPGVTDLIVVSHGWHMNASESQVLYQTLIGNLVNVAGGAWAAGRKVGVCGVFWPSDRFRDDLGQETVNVLADGHAAAAGGELNVEVLKAQAAEIAKFLGILDPGFGKLVLRAQGGGGDADKLVDVLRAAVDSSATVDEQTKLDHKELLEKPGHYILEKLQAQGSPALSAVPAPSGGSAAALGQVQQGGQALGLFSGVIAGIAKLLNQFAYFELKKRAGAIGEKLGGQLDSIAGLNTVRVHLVGHSFGARLVTAATAAMQSRKVQSMTLLQGAFSHNSFSAGIDYEFFPNVVGGFRDVIGKRTVKGPIAITHTWNDKAVGLAYPAASRVSMAIANAIGVSEAFGGSKDVFGGMGANGAMGLSAVEGSARQYDGKTPLQLPDAQVSSLRCDFIEGHNDVARPGAARVVLAAMGAAS
jgi:hypothetical protein